MADKQEPGEHIEISVDIKQVKVQDDVLQGCEAMTVKKDEKVTLQVTSRN